MILPLLQAASGPSREIDDLHAALDRAGVPRRFRRYAERTYLTHDWYEIDALERWKTEQLAMADAALADMTDRCRTAEQRVIAALKARGVE